MSQTQTYSPTHDPQPADFGTRLRRRRERMDLSLSDMSASTHIRAEYLAAIERLDASALPAIGYTLGFVRTYARALVMDASVAVADYKADVALTRLPLRDAPHVVLRRQLRLPRGFISASSVVCAAALMGLWYGTQSDAIATEQATPIAATQIVDAAPSTPILADDLFTLRTIAPSWIRVRDAAGQDVVSRIFVSGETWQAPIGVGYTVSVRDAGAVELYAGKERLGPLGLAGQPLEELTLSRDLPTSDRP